MSEADKTIKLPDISTEIFGGVLEADGAGLYPGLELFNYIYKAENNEILVKGENPKFFRTSQDFARRLVWDHENFVIGNEGKSVFVGETAADTLRHLLECLKLDVPNKKTGSWEAAHFFPHTRSLIHWDARRRSGGNSQTRIERRYYRGGGALAFEVLRSDKDQARYNIIKRGLEELLPEENPTALERLAKVLDAKGASQGPEEDSIAKKVRVMDEDGQNDFYRNGFAGILSHKGVSASARISSLLTWTGFWLATTQARRAAAYISEPCPSILVDCGQGASQIRKESNRRLKEILSAIEKAASKCAKEKEQELSGKDRQKLKAFFSGTAARIGLLNAFTGKRHFVLGMDLMETLVMAYTGPGSEVPFDDFVYTLFKNHGLVIDSKAATEDGLHAKLDTSVFDDNAAAFSQDLLAAGLMHSYSDATKMVSAEALKW